MPPRTGWFKEPRSRSGDGGGGGIGIVRLILNAPLSFLFLFLFPQLVDERVREWSEPLRVEIGRSRGEVLVMELDR